MNLLHISEVYVYCCVFVYISNDHMNEYFIIIFGMLENIFKMYCHAKGISAQSSWVTLRRGTFQSNSL